MSDTTHICYRVSSDKILSWLIPSTPDTLLGIQLHFREKTDQGFTQFNDILWSQVFLETGDSPNFYRVLMNGNAFSRDEQVLIEDSPESSRSSQPYQAGRDPYVGDKAYRRLEFYPEEDAVDFAFFEATQLKLMIAFNQTVTFSGATVSFGKQLGEYDDREVFDTEKFFALKMEGSDRIYSPVVAETAVSDFSAVSVGRTGSIDEDEKIEAKFSPVFIGPTCPPLWYVAGNIMRELLLLRPQYFKWYTDLPSTSLPPSLEKVFQPLSTKQERSRV